MRTVHYGQYGRHHVVDESGNEARTVKPAAVKIKPQKMFVNPELYRIFGLQNVLSKQ